MDRPADFLILSGRYIDPDMVAEFGLIPPSFLPCGMRRLFQRQVEFAAQFQSRIFITLPTDFQVPSFDQKYFDEQAVTVIRVASSDTIHAALTSALNIIDPQRELRLLHGDTLLSLDQDQLDRQDVFSAGSTDLYAVWGEYSLDESNHITTFTEALTSASGLRTVISGYFVFSSGPGFSDAIKSTTSFIGALNAYSKEYRLAPIGDASWLDFGHLHTYYNSKRIDLAARAFNSLEPTKYGIRKKSSDHRKIFAEANWFEQSPKSIKPFLPQVYSDRRAGGYLGYETEYLYFPSLAELFVFAQLPADIWKSVFLSCQDFLDLAKTVKPAGGQIASNFPNLFYSQMIREKSYERIEKFLQSSEFDEVDSFFVNGKKYPPIRKTLDALISCIEPTAADDICLWHGDFHFANIFFDFRSRKMKIIDPRGLLPDGQLSMFGDYRYDLAKLAHSVIGYYDYIVAGRYELVRSSKTSMTLKFNLPENTGEIEAIFRSYMSDRATCSYQEILSLTALLYFSMLPLHADSPSRQLAFLANAYRITEIAGVM